MALTESDIQEILEAVKAASQGIESLETVGSLSGVKSLPGQKDNKLVNVPLNLLTRLADSAADRANKASERVETLAPGMETATQKANEAADRAEALVPQMEDAVQKSDDAVRKAAAAEAAAKKAEDAVNNGYKHKEMTEEDFESLPEKDAKTVYLIYEEDQP